jgi:hypothetical protein
VESDRGDNEARPNFARAALAVASGRGHVAGAGARPTAGVSPRRQRYPTTTFTIQFDICAQLELDQWAAKDSCVGRQMRLPWLARKSEAPPMTRRSRTIVALIAGGVLVAGYVALDSGLGRALTGRSTRVAATYSKDAGYFYRFRAAFEVKITGEQLDFDYIVACNIRLTRWRDGGLSNDTSFSPRVMVQATAGGQAVILKTLDACGGLVSETNDVPADVLPVAIWFDSIAELSHGLAYASEDAYENPVGKLRFHGARIDRATRADWEAWRKKAADEYVERGSMPGPWGYDYPDNMNEANPDIGKYVSSCHGYRRLKLPEAIRAKIHPQWPSNRPQFWALANEDDGKVGELLLDDTVSEPPGGAPWLRRFGSPSSGAGVSWSGLPVRSGRWVQRPPHVPSRWPTEIYPSLWPPVTSAVPMTAPSPTAPLGVYVHKLEFRGGALNGFAACHNRKDANLLTIKQVDPDVASKEHVFVVDDQRVRNVRSGGIRALAPQFIFERDEYVFSRFSMGL